MRLLASIYRRIKFKSMKITIIITEEEFSIVNIVLEAAAKEAAKSPFLSAYGVNMKDFAKAEAVRQKIKAAVEESKKGN